MAGAGYKLFNTGDVLLASEVNTYLQEQVTMVFANATARTSALSGVLAEGMMSYLQDTNAVQVYNGTSWVAVGGSSPLTAKGDLYTYSTADARLAVGSNGDTLVADSAATTGLRYVPAPVVANPVINGAFDIWQRGTSFSVAASTGGTYFADRWMADTNANQACTFSRQDTGDTTNLPNIQYCFRFQRNSGQTGTGVQALFSSLETTNTIPFVGKTITLSFYARAGANYSASGGNLVYRLLTGTGTDQNGLTTGYTGSANTISETATLTTTWQRFSASATIPSTAKEMGVYFRNTFTGTAGAADYYEVTGVQIDIGSVALPFRRTGGTIQGELAACRRYYAKSYNQATAPGTASISAGMVVFPSTAALVHNSVVGKVFFDTVMRTAPTITVYGYAGGTSVVSNGDGTDLAANSGVPVYSGQTGFSVQNQSGGSITPTFNTFICHYQASAEL